MGSWEEALFGGLSAAGQVPSYQATSPFASMSAPTDPYNFSLGMQGANYGALGPAIGMLQMFGPMMGIPDPMASLGVHGGFGQFRPGQVFAARRYGQISRDVNRMSQSPESLARNAQQFASFESTLLGETVGVENDFATMREDPYRFGGTEKVASMEKSYRDELAALETAEASGKFGRAELARRRTDLVSRTAPEIAAAFKEGGAESELYSNRSAERAANFAKMVQENPPLVGLVGEMAKMAGVEGELDKSEFYRRTMTQAASLQFGYAGGGTAGIDMFGPKAENVSAFMGQLDKERQDRGFAKQGITSSDIGQTLSALATRGLGGFDSGQAQRVAEVAESMKELENVFGPGAPVEEIMRSLERMSNSSISGMGSSRIKAWGQKVQAVADMANMSTQDLVRAMEGGAQDAIRRGMSGDVGAMAALGAVSGASALREQKGTDRGGAGSLTETQAQSALYGAGMEVANSRMGLALGNVYGVAVTKAMKNNPKLSQQEAEAMTPEALVAAAGMGAETSKMLLDAYTATGGTADYVKQFGVENEGNLVRQLSRDLGMSQDAARAMMFSELNGSEAFGLSGMLAKGNLQIGNVREKFTALAGDKFALLRSSGRGGEMSKVEALFNRAMAGDTRFDISQLSVEEVSALRDTAHELRFGSVESVIAMAAGTKNAEQAEKAVSFNQALQKAGYGNKTATANILNLVLGGDPGGKRSLSQAFGEAAGQIDIKDTLAALEKAGITGDEAQKVLAAYRDQGASEEMIQDAKQSKDPKKRAEALAKLGAISLKTEGETKEAAREKDEKLSSAMEALTAAISAKSGKEGRFKLDVELIGDAKDLFKVTVRDEAAEKAAQEASK